MRLLLARYLFSICILFIFTFTTALFAGQKADKEYIDETDRILLVDPIKTAKEDILAGQLKIFAHYSSGGRHVPAFSESDANKLSDDCEVVTMESVGDVIYSDAHFNYYKAYLDFAAKYNGFMLSTCSVEKASTSEDQQISIN